MNKNGVTEIKIIASYKEIISISRRYSLNKTRHVH